MATNGIVLSSSVRTNLLSLQDTTSQQGIVQNRLATGKRVISALDNPTNFFTSAGLTQRANDLKSLLDGISNGVKTLEAASNGTTSITKVIESMQANLRQARQDKSFKGQSFALDAARTGNITFSGGSVAPPVNVSVAPTTPVSPTTLAGSGANFSSNFTGGTITANGQNVTIRGDVSAVSASVAGTGAVDYSGDPDLSALTGQSVTVTDESGTARTYTFTGASTGQAAALKTALEATSSGYAVTLGATGVSIARSDGKDFTVDSSNAAVATSIGIADNTLTTNGTQAFDATAATVVADFTNAGITGLTATQSGQLSLSLANGADLTLGGADALLTAIGFGTSNRTSTNGTEAVYGTLDSLVTSINGNASLTGKIRASNDGGKLRIENLSTKDLTIGGVGNDGEVDGTAGTAAIGGNEVRRNLMQQFNDLRDQLDKIAGDAGFNGVNLLRGDKLRVVFNERSTSSLDIEAKNKTGVSGVSTASNSLNVDVVTEETYSNDILIDARYDALKDSMTTLQSQSSQLGANLSVVQIRQDFTKQMITTLQTGSDFLVNADMNEEGANLLALNTRQQLSQTALSLASQADQAVLRLFG